MPEGDTLHRTAHTLARVLAGQRLVRVRSSVPAIAQAELAGHVVEAVSAQGKNLLVRFDDGRVLHTHLKMRGSWHVYRPGERFQRPEQQARVVLEVADALAVCFAAPTVRLLAPNVAENDPYLNGLGPDLIPDEFDEAQAVAGLQQLAELSLGEAVMTQTALSGIGNIYKSETLFVCRCIALSGGFRARSRRARARRPNRARAAAKKCRSRAQPSAPRPRARSGQYWVYARSGRAVSRVRRHRAHAAPGSTAPLDVLLPELSELSEQPLTTPRVPVSAERERRSQSPSPRREQWHTAPFGRHLDRIGNGQVVHLAERYGASAAGLGDPRQALRIWARITPGGPAAFTREIEARRRSRAHARAGRVATGLERAELQLQRSGRRILHVLASAAECAGGRAA